MVMASGSLIFVYGTLKRGEGNDLSRWPNVEFVGEDAINGDIFELGWYPGVKTVPGQFDPGSAIVRGEVFRILDDDAVERLDSYEGYPNLYDRIETETAEGLHVWVYTFNGERTGPRIESGWWTSEPIKELARNRTAASPE